MRTSLFIEDSIKNQIIIDYSNNLSLSYISTKYKYSIGFIRRLLAKNNIIIRKRWKDSTLIPYQDKIIQFYLNDKLSPSKIGEIYSVRGATITHFLKKCNIPLRDYKISTNSNIKSQKILQQSSILKIIELYNKEFIPIRELALLFNLPKGEVTSILKNNNIYIRNGDFQRKYGLNDHYFDLLDDFDKNYYLGLLFADGCNISNRHRITLGLKSEDKYILYYLAKLLNISHIDRVLKDNYINKFSCFSTLKFTSTQISNTLFNYGCVDRKSLILKFPSYFNDDFLDAFCLGYFDGDGCICKHFNKSSRTFCYIWSLAGSYDFLSVLADKLDKKLSLSMQLNPHGSIFELTVSEQESVYKLYMFLYRRSTIFLKRKWKIFHEFIKTYEIKSKIIYEMDC